MRVRSGALRARITVALPPAGGQQRRRGRPQTRPRAGVEVTRLATVHADLYGRQQSVLPGGIRSVESNSVPDVELKGRSHLTGFEDT